MKRYKTYSSDILAFLEGANFEFDLVVTSPPYNIGKEYEKKQDLLVYRAWIEEIVAKIIPLIKETGSFCFQVGNFVSKDGIYPLDILFHDIFLKHGMSLKNRIIWHYGHGLHSKKRFSGRYEVVMWYTKSEKYKFFLDPVRIPSKYPNKKYYSGPNKGKISSNPLGKNPSDVWLIPNVKSNHVEKTLHPCQFPVGLVERLVLSMTEENDTVFDPFMGVGSAGVASLIHNRNFVGVDNVAEYVEVANERLKRATKGQEKYRVHNKEIYEPNN